MLVVEHIPLHEVEIRVLREARAAERVAMEVVNGDDLVLVDEAARKSRADEASPSGDDDPLPAQWHAGESSSRVCIPLGT